MSHLKHLSRPAPRAVIVFFACAFFSLCTALVPSASYASPTESEALRNFYSAILTVPYTPDLYPTSSRDVIAALSPSHTFPNEATNTADLPPEALYPALPHTHDTKTTRVFKHATGIVHASISSSVPQTWMCRNKAYGKKLAAKPAPEPKSRQARRIDWTYRGSPLLRKRLMGNNIEYWRTIRPLYFKRGVCRPARFMTQGIVPVSFLDYPLYVNARIAPLLKRAELRLDHLLENPSKRPFDVASCFYPRTTRGPFGTGKNLSRHGLGLAIDFDYTLNPYLTTLEVKLIEDIAGVKIQRAAHIPAGKRWDSFHAAQNAWFKHVDTWLQDAETKLALWKRKPRKRRAYQNLKRKVNLLTHSKNLTRAREKGFLSIPRDLAVELERAGLTWATDFRSGPDIMHFELRTSTPKRAKHTHKKEHKTSH